MVRNTAYDDYPGTSELINFRKAAQSFVMIFHFYHLSDPKETLDEAFEALENGETEGFLLDAYVAGSGVNRKPYRVNKVIDVTKGLGVVLAGESLVLRHRVRDFVKKNAGKITEIIQNSTTPLRVSNALNSTLLIAYGML